MLTAEIKDGKLIIVIDADDTNPSLSKSGKSRIIATTSGNVTTKVIVAGKPMVLGLNAYIRA